ncbi:alpha/beta hydrolase [Gracilimonas mengyeensis]|uniref:Acetyl esterase/lipase n=1 Tax=Gracilimonas mengyeensis TaxID=1302730 RepID=A0A521E2M1_9BACT|nr:alpha/beta hydrolase [Gracilimonas mengyeensis]SMO78152.1 Acetyl esterase/lipase [Gracilimonas mengyeensis]
MNLIVKVGYTIFSLAFGMILQQVAAQDFPRDTSYTLQSAYQKYVKDYPEITKADSISLKVVARELDVAYKNTGQRDLSLDIFFPKDKAKELLPAVIMIHGGGWISGDKSLLHPLAAHVAAHGYVAITPEYRLSPEAQYPASVYDIKTAIKWGRDHAGDFFINPEKIALLGTSAGGQLAALVATTPNQPKFKDPADTSDASTDVQALVDIDGVLAFIHPVSEEGEVAGKWLGGNAVQARDTWLEASALTHAGAETPPALFIGSAYPRFLAGRREMTDILNRHNIYTRTYIFEEAPHSFWLFHPWFEPTLKEVTEFLDRVLKD